MTMSNFPARQAMSGHVDIDSGNGSALLRSEIAKRSLISQRENPPANQIICCILTRSRYVRASAVMPTAGDWGKLA